ncbi:MAG TPA: UDP-N-acetylglucosamine 2-epimerase (non-hydrolyzing) [Acidimicrobiales bacterium]|nr:UDP-N-acetylglucosamine 2-epimerase (non-hydrolyzing) [Acidimicrobiales bacterium]
MRILSIVGARPQFIKLGAIVRAIHDTGDDHIVLHTGQHYDYDMSGLFFDELSIPKPDYHLGVGSGSHAQQTAAMLVGIEEHLSEIRPQWTLVYGDTNSTVAGALAAAKLHFRVAHVEAGLRSFNRLMPEELNRITTDHLSDLCFAPTVVAMSHLTREGIGDRSLLTGDVMADICYSLSRNHPESTAPSDDDNGFILATIHRAENTDARPRLAEILQSLAELPLPVRLLAHPRLRRRCQEFGLTLDSGSLHSFSPVGYAEMLSLVRAASAVVTDSGGLQKEAYLLATPCTTIRPETEWPETLHHGWNVLVDPGGISPAVLREPPLDRPGNEFGTGTAAQQILAELHRRP